MHKTVALLVALFALALAGVGTHAPREIDRHAAAHAGCSATHVAEQVPQHVDRVPSAVEIAPPPTTYVVATAHVASSPRTTPLYLRNRALLL